MKIKIKIKMRRVGAVNLDCNFTYVQIQYRPAQTNKGTVNFV